MKVNRIKWSKIKMQWDGKLRAAAAFKGIMDYEEWAMGLAQPIRLDNPDTSIEPLDEGWMTPEEFDEIEKRYDMFGHQAPPRTEKEKLFAQAKEIRKQLDDAITVEDYAKAEVLQKTLDVIEIKYNKL